MIYYIGKYFSNDVGMFQQLTGPLAQQQFRSRNSDVMDFRGQGLLFCCLENSFPFYDSNSLLKHCHGGVLALGEVKLKGPTTMPRTIETVVKYPLLSVCT